MAAAFHAETERKRLVPSKAGEQLLAGGRLACHGHPRAGSMPMRKMVRLGRRNAVTGRVAVVSCTLVIWWRPRAAPIRTG